MRRVSRHLVPAALLVAAAVACGQDDSGPQINTGPMHTAFEDASIESGVPKDLLMAIGWHASHWVQLEPEDHTAADPEGGGHGDGNEAPPTYGVMQLSVDPANDTVDLAAQLTGIAVDQVKKDTASNIRGAAAVLRRYADEMFTPEDAAKLDLMGWRDVVARWTGYTDPDQAYGEVEEIYAVLRDGAGATLSDGEVLELLPNPGVGQPEDGSAAGSTGPSGIYGTQGSGLGYSGAHWVPAASSNYSQGRYGTRVQYIVIHDMEGSYGASISWFQNPSSQVSAHYMVRSRDGDITQMVDENNTAWHAGNWEYNKASIGIEHEGFMNDASWYTDAMYRKSALLSCDIVKRYGIPIDHTHILGHANVPGCPGGNGGGSGCHRDPGPHWNWDYYLSLIRECAGGGGGSTGSGGGSSGGGSSGGGTTHPGNGTIQGVVYQNGNVNDRIGGAHVKLSNGMSATAASNGYWSLSVPAGNYTVTAGASGYNDASRWATVTSGGQAWASVGLSKSGGGSSIGHVSGIVYEAGNSGHRIGGATVQIGARSTTTNSLGQFSLEADAGSQSATVRASGYTTEVEAVSVHAGQTAQLNVGLAKTSSAPGSVSGYVYDLGDSSKRVAGASVSITEGSTSKTATADANGAFSFTGLAPGQWRVSASAPGYGGGSTSVGVAAGGHASVSVGLRSQGGQAGDGTIEGVIYESPDSMKRISGASVVLSTGEHVTTGSDGVYKVKTHGTVTVVASAAGYLSKSTTRVVPVNGLVWGSIGLTKGSDNGGGIVGQCKPSGAPHVPPAKDAMPVNPLKGDVVTATPKLEFTGVGDPTASYIIRLVPGAKNAKNIEFKVGPGDHQTVSPPNPLPKDGYAWTVIPIWPDCATKEPAGWGFFVVQ